MAKLRGGAGSSENFHSSIIHTNELEGSKPDTHEGVEEFNLPEHEEVLEKIDEQIQKLKELRSAVKDIPVLFDTNDFKELIDHLSLLEEAGVQHVQTIAESQKDETIKNLSIKKIKKLIEEIKDEYSEPKTQEALRKGIIDRNTIKSILLDKGVTRNKIISTKSRYGFRECIINCIDSLVQIHNENSSEEIEKKDEESRTKMRRAIEDM